MSYDPAKHQRRSIRLRGHDYAGGGAYFVTASVKDNECLFGQIVEAEMILGDAGQLVEKAGNALPERFNSIIFDAFHVMPNHVHAIIVIPGPGLEPALARATGAPIIHPNVGPTLGSAGPGQAPALRRNARPNPGRPKGRPYI